MSRRVEKLAREMADVVRDAGTDVFAHEIRELFESRGWTPQQTYAAGRIAESWQLIEQHGKRLSPTGRRLVWGAPRRGQS